MADEGQARARQIIELHKQARETDQRARQARNEVKQKGMEAAKMAAKTNGICPLARPGLIAAGKEPYDRAGWCLRKDCLWYVGTECGVVTIAKAAAKVGVQTCG